MVQVVPPSRLGAVGKHVPGRAGCLGLYSVRAAMVELEKGWYVMTKGREIASEHCGPWRTLLADAIDAAIAAAVAGEREACATTALQQHIDIYAPDAEARSEQSRIIAAAIRARGGA
jgi:hypothetical protein